MAIKILIEICCLTKILTRGNVVILVKDIRKYPFS